MDDELELELDTYDEEFSLVPTNEISDDFNFPIYLKLKGMLIEEEIDEIKSMCSDEESSYRSVPLFLQLYDNGSLDFVGYLDLDLNTLLVLRTLNPNYYLTLCEKDSGNSSDLLSPKLGNVGEILSGFIRLN